MISEFTQRLGDAFRPSKNACRTQAGHVIHYGETQAVVQMVTVAVDNLASDKLITAMCFVQAALHIVNTSSFITTKSEVTAILTDLQNIVQEELNE